jgi:PPOX class probable F420-dependent enzyme
MSEATKTGTDTAVLPEGGARLVDGPNFATVATIEPDGSVQLSEVWVRRDGDDVLFSTTTNRRKYTNLRRDPRVTVLVHSAENPYSYLEVRGTATITTEGGRALIDELAAKYTGAQRYPGDDGTSNERVVVRVTPRHVVFHG